MKRTSIFALLTMVCPLLALPVTARPPTIPQLFHVDLATNDKPVPGVPFVIEARISIGSAITKLECDKPYRVVCEADGKLEIIEAPNTDFSIDSGQVFDTRLTVKCTPNDTARVEFLFKCGSGFWPTTWWIVSDDTSVVVQRRYPTRPFPPKPDPHAAEILEYRIGLQADSARYRGLANKLRERPFTSRAPSAEEDITHWLYRLDTELPAPPLPGVPMLTRQELLARQLEATRADTLEVFWVEGTHYVRRPGDSTYQCFWCFGFEQLGEPGLHRVQETAMSLPANHLHSMVFYVPKERSSAVLQTACGQVAYLGDWWQFQLYRGKTTFDKLPALRAAGIGFWLDAFFPPIAGDPVLESNPDLQERLLHEFTPVDTEKVLLNSPYRIQRQEGSVPPLGPPPRKWPNLVPYTPPGWPGPTMLQNYDTVYVNHTTDLYIGERFLFHWGVKNIGDTTTFIGLMGVELDDGGAWPRIVELGGTTLVPGAVWVNADDSCGCAEGRIPEDLDPGTYDIRYVVDINNDVREGPLSAQEADNVWNSQVHLVEPFVEYDGYLRFVDQPSGDTLPVRDVKIELWDRLRLLNPSHADSLLDSATTDSEGRFHFGPIYNRDQTSDIGYCLPRLDLYFRYSAENSAAKVVPEFGGLAYHSDSTQFIGEHPNGQFDTVIVIAVDSAAAPYALADRFLDARDAWTQLGFAQLSQVEVRLAEKDTTSRFFRGTNQIHIETMDNPDIGAPDAYDKFVVSHEYAHFGEQEVGFCDAGGGSHEWNSPTELTTASSEGFATWFACHQHASNRFYNHYSDFAHYAWYDVESGRWGVDQTTFSSSPNNCGPHFEGAVAGAFWDIYDSDNDDCDTLFTCWITAYQHYVNHGSDGIADTLSGLTAAMVSSLRLEGGATAITDMWTTWMHPPSYGHVVGLADIMAEHGIGCFGVTGDSTCDGIVDLSDLSGLISFLTGGGYVPHCQGEANVNGDSFMQVDLSDLSALTSYLSGGGYVLPSCVDYCQ